MSFRYVATLVCCLVVSTASGASSLPPGLIGTWQLQSRTDRTADGHVVPEPSLGAHPTGYLIYDNAGHMAAQLSASDRADVTCAITSAAGSNNPEHIGGYDAYFGRYEVDTEAGLVTHIMDGALSPHDVGRHITRRFHLEGDTLTIQFEPGGTGITRTIVWKRISK